MCKVILSIVSHRQQDLVQKLLLSLDQCFLVGSLDVAVVVVENTTSVWRPISERFELTYLQNLRHKGFGANHNSTFERFQCDYFIVLNPDIIFNKAFDLNSAILHMRDREIAIASPVIVDQFGNLEDYKRSDLTFFGLLRRHLFKKQDKVFDWFAGICLIFKAEAYLDLKGFDTKYFMYVEDCDICMRAKTLGLQLSELSHYQVMHAAQRHSRRNFKSLLMHLVSLFKYWFT